jgi:hypothetical protein
MKKLLATTALVSLVAVSAANAETKISGNLAISYMASSEDLTTASNGSWNAFGKETQINISNSGDLNNGMKYAAGFSWELDGGETMATGAGNENVYIDLIAGSTTFSLSADHIPTINQNPTNLVGFGYVRGEGATGTSTGLYTANQGEVGSSYSFAVMQKFGGTTLTAAYAPHVGADANRDIFNANNATSNYNTASSATSINLTGDLGVAGLNVFVGRDQQSKQNTTAEITRTKYAATYKSGKFTVAAERDVYDADKTSANEITSQSVGVAYAVSDTVSVGATMATAERGANSSSQGEEKTTIVAVGYNLGAVSLQVMAKDINDHNGTIGYDAQQVGFYLGTKF